MPAIANQNPIRLAIRLKWGVSRLLERLSELRGNSAAGQLELHHPASPIQALWVFVSTIGELNAIDPLLREIIACVPQRKLVLITDHPHYRTSYQARYPSAEVCVTRGHGTDAATLAKHHPPQLLVVAEIPCWPSDAPCRFSFAFLLAAKHAGANTVLVNAWLYHYTTPSLMDAIERNWFQADYVRAFYAIDAQTAGTRQLLIVAGADPTKVAVVGNIKFDAMPSADWSPAHARSPVMLGALIASARPVIVAGCVTSHADQELVLDSFVSVRNQHPEILLVLAPRHPEVAEHMQALRGLLAQRALASIFKSTLSDTPIAADTACLVQDTMGELRDFYASATVAHVGVDHNVLEPLGIGKPVTVGTGRNDTYPSYPVYRSLMDSNVLFEPGNVPNLADYRLELLGESDHCTESVTVINNNLGTLRGAVKRHLAQAGPMLNVAC